MRTVPQPNAPFRVDARWAPGNPGRSPGGRNHRNGFRPERPIRTALPDAAGAPGPTETGPGRLPSRKKATLPVKFAARLRIIERRPALVSRSPRLIRLVFSSADRPEAALRILSAPTERPAAELVVSAGLLRRVARGDENVLAIALARALGRLAPDQPRDAPLENTDGERSTQVGSPSAAQRPSRPCTPTD
jgi:hypothetical protein